ncbi:MAG: putative nucleotidyltransferase substrate binding domain-containing protein [Rhodospirillales bacterium]|jgi:CBS domain-containing protein|nr:putative nucleotidyltransferase substrate binding domain-containing protein [Rhodospirillales bacterium]
MDSDLAEIRDFLAALHPFDLLPAPDIQAIVRTVEIRYARKGSRLIEPGNTVEFLHIIRSGAIETHDGDGQLLARLGEGDFCGVRSLLRGGTAINRSVAIEDCLLYLLPAAVFETLRRAHRQVDYYFAPMAGGRLGESLGLSNGRREINLLGIRVGDMLSRPPVTIGPAATVREAAIQMRVERVSCLLVTERERLRGIFTDRDLRTRVVAEGLDAETPLSHVMTPDPICIGTGDYGFDALLAMARNNVHHLPVLRDGAIAGCITTTNLIETQTTSTIFLAGDIHKQTSPEGLAGVLSHLPELVLHLAESGAAAHHIGHVVSTLTDAATVRLIQLAERRLGPPPVPYAWLAAGSQGRHEQTARSDQDNVIVLDDAYEESAHADYFRDLSRFVCDGLADCGYVHCPGGMMAMTDEWRQPLARWTRYFLQWIDQPEPKALLFSSVFFDLRRVYGEARLFEALQPTILEHTRRNRIFQAFMASNAVKHQPPLGFFRNLVLIRGGQHDRTLDLKHAGIGPIVDIARVYALATGVPAVNTRERLEAVQKEGALSAESAADLRDALEFISLIRLRHQARMIRQGQEANNFLEPGDLSSFERTHLKDAFAVVKSTQAVLADTYQTGRF